MKDNLLRILYNIPNDNEYRNVKYHLTKAVQYMEDIERKTKNKKSATEVVSDNSWKFYPGFGVVSPEYAKSILQEIDKLKKIEEDKIDRINSQKGTSDNGFQTIFG